MAPTIPGEEDDERTTEQPLEEQVQGFRWVRNGAIAAGVAAVLAVSAYIWNMPDVKGERHTYDNPHEQLDQSKFITEYDMDGDGEFDGSNDITYIIDPKNDSNIERLAARQGILDATSDYQLKMMNLGERPDPNAKFQWLYRMHDRTATVNREKLGFDEDDNRRILVIPADPIAIVKDGAEYFGIPLKPSELKPDYSQWDDSFHRIEDRQGADVYGRQVPEKKTDEEPKDDSEGDE